jgi:hypothetical protein
MKAHHQNGKHHVALAIFNSVNPETYTPPHLTTKALNDDSCWDEYDSDFDECISSHLLNCIEDFEAN